jgi:DNA-directed RNA polymerase subunit RPC12/RpoP
MEVYCSQCGSKIEYGEGNQPIFCCYCGNRLHIIKVGNPATQLNLHDNESTQFFETSTQSDIRTEEKLFSSSLGNEKSNSYCSSILGWAIFVLIASIIRLVVSLFSLSDVEILESFIYYGNKFFLNTEIIKSYIIIVYIEIFIIILLFAISIVIMINAVKVGKNKFPVRDEEVFGNYKSAYISSSIGIGVFIAFFIVEFVRISRYNILYEVFDIPKASGSILFSFAFSVLIFVGIIIIAVRSNALLNAKINSVNSDTSQICSLF